MAEKRMFAKTIIDSDAFIDMPVSTRLLYYDLGMRADDDGFVNSPKKIMRMIGSTEDDIKLLITKKFIIPFDSGVVVIKHWRINNYLRGDRYRGTTYTKEKSLLRIDGKGAYTMDFVPQIESGIPTGIPTGNPDKVSIDKYSIDKTNIIKENSNCSSNDLSPKNINDEKISIIHELFDLYENNIGLITPIIQEEIRAALKIFPPEKIEFAINEATKKNHRSWSYVAGVLNNQGCGARKSPQNKSSPPDDIGKYNKPDDYYGRHVQR